MGHTNSIKGLEPLDILGIGVEYPPHKIGPEALEILAQRHYADSQALSKVLSINRFTGIDTRASVGTLDHPLVNQENAPSISQLSEYFLERGVGLSVAASQRAIKEWGGSVSDITHMVSTTCTNSANPGFDHYVGKALGLGRNVEKILLHGIGCSGGLAAIRTACNLALGSSYCNRRARILVVACEICTLLVRSELDSIALNEEVRIGCCLFSDCASACILGNELEMNEKPVYEIHDWQHELIEDTAHDLGFDVDSSGWKVILSPRVPQIAVGSVHKIFDDLKQRMLQTTGQVKAATEFDWAIHPGGITILHGLQQALGISDEALMAAAKVYVEYGNSSSATIISVLDRLRHTESNKKDVMALAFGPGVVVEAMRLQRCSL